MQENEKINVAGKMKSLAVGESFSLKRSDYLPSSVRTTAYLIKQDFGLGISVFLRDPEIYVERTM